MKNYVKPLVVANEELAEGIYAASGDKWIVGNDSNDSGETKPYDTSRKLDFKYEGEGNIPAQCTVTLVFDQAIKYFNWGFNQNAMTFEAIPAGNTVTFTFNPEDDPEDKTYPFVYIVATGDVGKPILQKVSAQ